MKPRPFSILFAWAALTLGGNVGSTATGIKIWRGLRPLTTHARDRNSLGLFPGWQRLITTNPQTPPKALAKAAGVAKDTEVATQLNIDAWTGNGWANDTQSEYTVNSNAQVIGFKDQHFYNSAWQNIDSGSLTYDSLGRSSTLNQVFWDSLGQWAPYVRLSYAYPNDSVQLFLHENWDDSASKWVNDEHDSSVADAQQNPLLTVVQYWTDSAWLNSDRYANLFNAQELPLRYTHESWNAPQQQWVLDTRDTLVYNDSGLLSNQTEVARDSLGEYVNRINRVFTWAGVGHPSEVITQSWNGSQWQNSYKEDYAYDSLGNDTAYVYSRWGGAAWQNMNKTASTYDSSGNILQSLRLVWNSGNGSWDNSQRGRWVYAQFNVAVLPSAPARLRTPTVQWIGGAFVLSGLEGIDQVQIRDFLGRQIARLSVRNGVAAWRPAQTGPALAVGQGPGVFFHCKLAR